MEQMTKSKRKTKRKRRRRKPKTLMDYVNLEDTSKFVIGTGKLMVQVGAVTAIARTASDVMNR